MIISILSAFSAFPQSEKTDFRYDTIVFVKNNVIKNVDYNIQKKHKKAIYGHALIVSTDEQVNLSKNSILQFSHNQNLNVGYSFRTKKVEWAIGVGIGRWLNKTNISSTKNDTTKTITEKIDTISTYYQIINNKKVPFYVLDTTKITKENITTTNINNKFKSSYYLVSIPISMSYVLRYHRFEFLPQIEFISKFCIQNSDENSSIKITPQSFSAGLAVNLRYYLDTKLSVGAYLIHQQNISSFFENLDWLNNTLGIGASLKYQFD